MHAQPFVINFHGIGKPRRVLGPGEESYWLNREYFESVLDFVAQDPLGSRVQLTFDDGNSSDYEIAAPELRRRRLGASFFVLAGKLGSQGYMSKAKLHDLSAQGFEIGSHGMDHVVWTNASDETLAREINDSKAILEGITGIPVRSVAIPFGYYNNRVLRELRRCGYHNVYSSDGGPRLTRITPTPRYSLQQKFSLATLPTLITASNRYFNRAVTETHLLIKTFIQSGRAT